MLSKLTVFGTCLVTVLFLMVTFEPYDPVNDYHGKGALFKLVGLSALHLILGLGLLLGSVFGSVRPTFAILVLIAPFVHMAAAPVEGVWCQVLLAAPSVPILVAGASELMWEPVETRT